MVHRKQKIMFWIKFSLLQTSPHHGFVLNLLHDLIFWRRRRRRTWRTSSRPKRLRWRRRMILMMVEATKSYIWFGGPYKALNHPKSSSRNPCGPNCLLLLFLLVHHFLPKANRLKREKVCICEVKPGSGSGHPGHYGPIIANSQ